jgi:hypothetical protein
MGVEEFKKKTTARKITSLHSKPGSLRYLLMPTIDGTGEYDKLPPPLKITKELHMIPGVCQFMNLKKKFLQGGVMRIEAMPWLSVLSREFAHLRKSMAKNSSTTMSLSTHRQVSAH